MADTGAGTKRSSGALDTFPKLLGRNAREHPERFALRYAKYGYILETGRVVLDGEAEALSANEDVKEFYLGVSGEKRKSFRDVKHYRRRKRWLA